MNLARKHFTEFKERSGNVSDAELDDFWATLAPAKIDEMIGEWKGGDFPTGHRATGLMQKLGWFGKTFKSASDAQGKRQKKNMYKSILFIMLNLT